MTGRIQIILHINLEFDTLTTAPPGHSIPTELHKRCETFVGPVCTAQMRR